MMIDSNSETLIEQLDKLSIKSAGCKYREVLIRVFDEWASSDDDFRYNYELFKVVSKTMFFNHFEGYLTAAMGGSSIPSTILNLSQRQELLPHVRRLISVLENANKGISFTSNLEEKIALLRSEFVDEILAEYFQIDDLIESAKYSAEVKILDDWMSGIIAEVITSSIHGNGSPTDSEHRLFYLMLEDKQTHSAAAFLIGADLLENWLKTNNLRKNIAMGITDDLFGDEEE